MQTHAHELNHEAQGGGSLNRLAALATLHCLTGCAIGEVLGLVIGTALGWSNAASIALAVTLAFVFGYSLTMVPLLKAGMTVAVALPLAFASDSFSIAVMELVDNGVMLAVPGAMDSPLTNPLFWGALAFAFAVAYVVALPVNRYLISRGRGHAVVHQFHGQHEGAADSMHGHEHADAASDGGLGSPRKLIAIGLAAMAATIAIATAGAIFVESRHDNEEMVIESHGTSGGHGAAAELSGLAVAGDGYQLVVTDTTLSAAEATRFSFSVVDADGPVRQFDEEGGVRMHLIVVRRDLTGYQHLHPILEADGRWQTEMTLPAAGVYRAYVDFERDGKKTVLAGDLFVAGQFTPASLPAPASTVEVAGYRVELHGHAEAGVETTITCRVMRAGEPVDIEPYLDAAGHLVALREGDLGYLHVHPLAERLGEISFAATFPTAGRYRLFLQFKEAGRVQTAPLTLNVGRGH